MKSLTICKQFRFCASHQLTKVGPHHKCSRLHGHNYKVDVELRGRPDRRGFVMDYAQITEAWSVVHNLLDHRHLNDIEGLENPTCEVLAPFILDLLVDALPLIRAVRVRETDETWCEVRR